MGEVAGAAGELPGMVIDLFDAALPPAVICRAITSVHDAVTRRLIEFAEDELGRPPVPYTWLAAGSFGRFEPFPSSDVDCAIAWDGPDDDIELRRTMITLAERVLDGLEACGFPRTATPSWPRIRCSRARSTNGSARPRRGSSSPIAIAA